MSFETYDIVQAQEELTAASVEWLNDLQIVPGAAAAGTDYQWRLFRGRAYAIAQSNA